LNILLLRRPPVTALVGRLWQKLGKFKDGDGVAGLWALEANMTHGRSIWAVFSMLVVAIVFAMFVIRDHWRQTRPPNQRCKGNRVKRMKAFSSVRPFLEPLFNNLLNPSTYGLGAQNKNSWRNNHDPIRAEMDAFMCPFHR
jgi:hypothetical protein